MTRIKRRQCRKVVGMIGVLAATASLVIAQPVDQRDCATTSTGLIPITELGAGLYLGQFEGGLYPTGSNLMPIEHGVEGNARAQGIAPLNTAGLPDPNGRYVLLSIGLSNTTQEFCSQNSQQPCEPWSFMGQAAAHPDVDTANLAIVNGARGSQIPSTWDDPTDLNYDLVQQKLLDQGLSEAQVQAVWLKEAEPRPTISLPDPGADAFFLMSEMANMVRAAKLRYPNLRIIFFSSRIYAGYAGTNLNPEPYAYETAFSCKWLIEHQINQMNGAPIDPLVGDLDYTTVAPWLAWGPYLWADGLTPRSPDGLTYTCDDMAFDGTHPDVGAETKVGSSLLEFFLASPHSRPWFRAPGSVLCEADVNDDGIVDVNDISFVLFKLGTTGQPGLTPGDADNNGIINVNDISFVLFRLGNAC